MKQETEKNEEIPLPVLIHKMVEERADEVYDTLVALAMAGGVMTLDLLATEIREQEVGSAGLCLLPLIGKAIEGYKGMLGFEGSCIPAPKEASVDSLNAG